MKTQTLKDFTFNYFGLDAELSLSEIVFMLERLAEERAHRKELRLLQRIFTTLSANPETDIKDFAEVIEHQCNHEVGAILGNLANTKPKSV